MAINARRTGVVSMHDAIEALLKTYNLKTKYNETYLVAFWEKMMGQTIASRTTQIYVKNKVLFLRINSAPLRNELVMAKSKLIELVNNDLGERVVEEVVFL